MCGLTVIKIICIGKIKRNALEEEMYFYLKQMQREVVIIELKDSANKLQIDQETKQILKNILPNDYVFCLVVDGQNQYNSIQFSKSLYEKLAQYQNICFIIGGSYGVEDVVLKRSDELISFGRLTMPHLLCRLVLIEQIYRAKLINTNHPYHK